MATKKAVYIQTETGNAPQSELYGLSGRAVDIRMVGVGNLEHLTL